MIYKRGNILIGDPTIKQSPSKNCKRLNKQLGVDLGYHRNVVADLIKRGAVVIDGVVYAPIKKRAVKQLPPTS